VVCGLRSKNLDTTKKLIKLFIKKNAENVLKITPPKNIQQATNQKNIKRAMKKRKVFPLRWFSALAQNI
jgi:hypothetical protein